MAHLPTITVEGDGQLLVRSMHPDQELAGDWRWVGDCHLQRPRVRARWAFNTIRGSAIPVVMDEEAPLLHRNHVTRALWRAVVAEYDQQQKYWLRQVANGQVARDAELTFLQDRGKTLAQQLGDLNDQARRMLP